MPTAIRVNDDLAQKAKVRAKAENRSAAGQIEYWSKIGQLAEENPDLTFTFLRDILMGLEEAQAKEVRSYSMETVV